MMRGSRLDTFVIRPNSSIIYIIHSCSTCIQVQRCSFLAKKISGLEWGSNPHTHISGMMLYQLSYQAFGSRVVGGKLKVSLIGRAAHQRCAVCDFDTTQVLRFSLPGKKSWDLYTNAIGIILCIFSNFWACNDPCRLQCHRNHLITGIESATGDAMIIISLVPC